MKKIILLSFVILLSTTLFAQTESDKYLRSANKALNEGRVDDAERQYKVYKSTTKKVDKNFELRLKAKKNKKNTDKKTPQNLSGNSKINEKNTAGVTAQGMTNNSDQGRGASGQSNHSSIKTVTVNGMSFDMVWVEGGTFRMGSNDGDSDERPEHSVTLDGFYIGKYEVQQVLWQLVMGYNPSYFKSGGAPVENVSWNDCQKFIAKLNEMTDVKFSLPTEAQWEYAARGGNKSNGYEYSGSNYISYVAWFGDNSDVQSHPVGQKQSNELGIYDMTGNVWEWCLDGYNEDFYAMSLSYNPVNNSSVSDRVYRGGSFGSSVPLCRSTNRNCAYFDNRSYYIGLRLVLLP